MTFTEQAKEQAQASWQGSFQHPFITELHEGTLSPMIFRYYLIQDHYYLKHFSQLYRPIAPTAYHYVSHMYRQLIEGTPKTAAASMLPCSWLYQEIGAQLVKQHSPEPLYQRWIETYAGEEAYQHVQEERQLLDQLYEESSPQEQAAMITAFVISSEMEYAFWEMAYTHETWIG